MQNLLYEKQRKIIVKMQKDKVNFSQKIPKKLENFASIKFQNFTKNAEFCKNFSIKITTNYSKNAKKLK